VSWSDVRIGMAAALKAALTGVSVYEMIPQALGGEPDLAVVLPGDPLILPTAHGVDSVLIRVYVRSTRGTQKDGAAALDKLIAASGTQSVRAAVNADRTLGGAVEDTRFMRVESYGALQDQSGAFQAEIIFAADMEDA